MPLYLVRRERCTPYEMVVQAPSMEEAETAAFQSPAWNEGCAYWQDIETEEMEDDGEEPDLVVGSEDDEDDGADDRQVPLFSSTQEP